MLAARSAAGAPVLRAQTVRSNGESLLEAVT
jgi:hypothetical protein